MSVRLRLPTYIIDFILLCMYTLTQDIMGSCCFLMLLVHRRRPSKIPFSFFFLPHCISSTDATICGINLFRSKLLLQCYQLWYEFVCQLFIAQKRNNEHWARPATFVGGKNNLISLNSVTCFETSKWTFLGLSNYQTVGNTNHRRWIKQALPSNLARFFIFNI